ncbi:MAG: cytochrome c [Chloroflexi bacterium]|nr:cytochrome c [Chloroflexota bacterium]
MRVSSFIITVALISVLFLGCAKSQPTPPAAPPAPPKPAVDAASLYGTNCAACHGQKREGVSGLGPALTPTILSQKSDTQLREVILKGKSGTAMPGFEGRLKAEEVDALVQLLKRTQP